MITENNITVVKLPKDPKDPPNQTTFEGSLRVMARHTVSDSLLDYPARAYLALDLAEIKLKRMLMDEVYGDLREPLNKLFVFARPCLLCPSRHYSEEYAEITAIREKLRAFL
ncbi:MAG: hypothetical protein GY743_19175 [Planctomycetaceae bacterium]|nr:hypothetical protein [Planctomycetaceae bacterium]